MSNTTISRSQYPWQRLATIGKPDGNGRLTVPIDTSANRIALLQMNSMCTETAVKYYSDVNKAINDKMGKGGDRDEILQDLAVETHRSRQFLFVIAATCLTDFIERCKPKFIAGNFYVNPPTAVPRFDNIEINFVFDDEEPCVLRLDPDCEGVTFKGLLSGHISYFTVSTDGLLKLFDFINNKYEKIAGHVDISEL